jgi:hypothetical protein
MASSKYDFSIDQGSSFSLVFTNKDEDGNIINLTNYCARLTMTTNLNDTIVFETENINYSLYKFLIEGNLGKISLLIPASVTNSYNFDTAKYDLEIKSPNDHYVDGGKYIERIMYGTITINKRYSKSSTLLDCEA